MTAVLITFASELWNTLTEMAPYLLFGFLVAGLLSVLLSPQAVERHLGSRGLWPVIKAALFGVPLPLCSCGVIPVAASLRKHGAGPGATTAFLLSTPQTGVDSIMVTLSLLGPVYAVFRPLAALVTGVVGGELVDLAYRGDSSGHTAMGRCQQECCDVEDGRKGISKAFHYGFVTLPRDLARPLIVGLLMAGVISASVPGDFLVGVLGTGILSMLVMMVLGIPVYVCATASVPVAAALIAKGISPGAALVFLMTGPATNAATIVTIWNLMGRRTVVIYLATVAGAALGSGILLNSILAGSAAPALHPYWALPGFVKTISAVILVGILVAAFGHTCRPSC